jgi:hypothetical protein
MSMWLDVVVMSKEAFDTVKTDNDLLGDVFQQKPDALKKLGIAVEDLSGCDYQSIDAAVTAMTEATGEGDDEADFQAEGALDYEGNYGPAMYWSPPSFAKALEEASGWQMATQMDDGLKALIDNAVKKKLWVVAVVN